ncbi:MAG TPA: 6,7-dimethyl-8-ribityllumazine synthase [Gemmatimonadales bacterium]|nr:6,7-dimethyl-8-ribityllumazine synthase [Gemmatimonadales bacterium]
MPTFEGTLDPAGRVAIVVSRYHERLTRRLAEGALAVCTEAGLGEEAVDTCWVDGAFELGVTVTALARGGGYVAIVALGIVIRGETPHFDFVAGETARMLATASTAHLVPVGFGLLTTDDLPQAEARSGGAAGNKGREAAEAALRTASLLRQVARP